MEIDLNTCKPGDILISSHGLELEYVSRTPWRHISYLDHVVKYPNTSTYGSNNYGSRTNDGYVYKHNRMPDVDHDIVKIIPKSI